MTQTEALIPFIGAGADPFKTPGGDYTPATAFINGVVCTLIAYRVVQDAPLFHKVVLLMCATCYVLLLYRMRLQTADRHGSLGEAFVHSYWGISEGYFGMVTMFFPVYALSLDAWRTCTGHDTFLPADRLAAFAAIWGMVHVVNSKLSAGSHMQYYSWFESSGTELSEKRGLGARGYAPYGLPTRWLPRPSVARFSRISFVKNLLVLSMAVELTPPALHCAAALPLYIVYASQLFANTNHGMHKPLVVLPALVYLMLAPQLWSATDAWGPREGPLWPAAFLKIHILSIYFAAGVGKPLAAAFMKKNWCGGPTMQYYLFATMWARPGGDKKSRELYLSTLGFLVERPWLCSLLSFCGLLWEIIAPIFASYGSWWSVAFFSFLPSACMQVYSFCRASISSVNGCQSC